MIENKCTVQGCCVPSEYLILPKQSDSSNPDLKSPNMALEVLKVLITTPYAIALFLCGVGRHIFYKSKRPTWDFNTMINIERIQIARTMLKWNHTHIWRAFLSIAPVKPISDVKKITCTVSKGTHCGIFQKCSKEEDGARTLEADWLTCNNPANKEKIMYYIHGGGFALFDKRCFNNLSTKFRDTFQRDVFAVRYRLSPESHFPGPLFDAFKGYLHLIDDRKIDPKSITVCGDSAGGNMSLSLLFYLREHGYPLPGACIVLSPWIDMSYSYPSWVEFSKYDYLPARPTFDKSPVNPSRAYLGRENFYALTQHPYASLQYIHDFENMPPTLIQSGGCEVLVDEIRAFASKMENSKTTRVTYEEYEDMFHVFQSFEIRKSDQAFESMKKWLEREELSKE